MLNLTKTARKWLTILLCVVAIAGTISLLRKPSQKADFGESPRAAPTRSRTPAGDPANIDRKDVVLSTTYSRIREKLQTSDSPTGDLLRIIGDLDKESGSRRRTAIANFFSALADFESPADALDWLDENRDLLSKTLPRLDVGQGRDGYDEIILRIASECYDGGVDFISAVKSIGNEELNKDVLPVKFRLNGEWDPADLERLDPDSRRNTELKTIRHTALLSFKYDEALRLMLDSKCSLEPDQALVTQVIDREYFWRNTSKMMTAIENSPPGPKRDLSLVRAIHLIAERDLESAQLWADLIQDQEKKQRLLSSLKKN